MEKYNRIKNNRTINMINKLSSFIEERINIVIVAIGVLATGMMIYQFLYGEGLYIDEIAVADGIVYPILSNYRCFNL